MPARDSLARKTFVVTSVAVLTLAAFLALWKLKVLVALLFLSFMLASAMRPGVERMVRFRVPRIGGVLAHYAVVAGLIALCLWFVVPNLLRQVDHAIGNVPQTSKRLGKEAKQATGIKHDILIGLQKELKNLPRTGNVVNAAVDAGRKALEILVGIFFVLAAAAYWIYERERAEDLVVSLLPSARRKTVKDTWDLVELKLGAYVRASLLLIGFVGTVLSFAFWAIGLPYWLLLGILAAVLEIIPVVGPLLAGIASVGVALTVSVEAAVLTAIAVYGLRLLQDYLIQPKVMGDTVGIAPLAVLSSSPPSASSSARPSCRSRSPSPPWRQRSPTSRPRQAAGRRKRCRRSSGGSRELKDYQQETSGNHGAAGRRVRAATGRTHENRENAVLKYQSRTRSAQLSRESKVCPALGRAEVTRSVEASRVPQEQPENEARRNGRLKKPILLVLHEADVGACPADGEPDRPCRPQGAAAAHRRRGRRRRERGARQAPLGGGDPDARPRRGPVPRSAASRAGRPAGRSTP